MSAATIQAIHNDAEHKAAVDELERLWSDERPASQSRLEVLAILIETYEREHHALPSPDPIEAIKFVMEQRGLGPKDLEPFIGTRSRVHEVLHGKRSLTLAMIRRLHHGLGIPAELLLGPDETPGEQPTVRARKSRRNAKNSHK
jgi:HTH-type transcriptional regulator/antitoxin HigA